MKLTVPQLMKAEYNDLYAELEKAMKSEWTRRRRCKGSSQIAPHPIS